MTAPADSGAAELTALDRRTVGTLLRAQRWAALATIGEGGAPHASMVAYAACPDLDALLMHLSRLARHTRNLLRDPAASLVISEPDRGGEDPQTLRRVSLQGRAHAVHAGDAAYREQRAAYLARLPRAAPRFDFPDFVLFRFEPSGGHYVAGFGRALDLDAAALRAAARGG